MSDQQAPPAAPSAQPDTRVVAKLHDHAVEAEKHVEQLATGLGEAGADPAAIKAVGQMADVLRRIAKGLGASAIKAQPQRPTMDDAADQMMAERAAPPQ